NCFKCFIYLGFGTQRNALNLQKSLSRNDVSGHVEKTVTNFEAEAAGPSGTERNDTKNLR
ncbi:MAG: hypothetical protein ACRCY0_00030, partial [Synechococcus elongatus]|uniref:hypothetical protein n=1 Tax=Synechococcus elongatus TaxID=32046 RepID=UPI003F2AB1D5